ncbi:MAG: hypothetical protein FWG73_06475 [Planctomycetaceae bacterium]|nr:hypothetical protein [Planctomycetaceae bacterium]
MPKCRPLIQIAGAFLFLNIGEGVPRPAKAEATIRRLTGTQWKQYVRAASSRSDVR